MSEVFKKYDRAIILEDDNLVSINFLDYMNKALDLYKKEKKVSSIYSYFPKTKKNLPDTFFLKGSWTFTWGIGIWRRSWRLFETDGKKLLKEIDKKKLKTKFNFNNSYDWYSMLERQVNRQNQSWSIRWYAATFLNNTFTLFPKYSLTKNIGMDGTGINTPSTKIWDVEPYKQKININKIKISESVSGYEAAKFFFNQINPLYIKIYTYIKRKVYKLI